MEKPLELKIRETKETLVCAINEAGLPAAIIKPIVQEILSAVSAEEQRQYDIAKKQYESSFEEAEHDV